jgi:cytochrome oxidase Cu insertion factor (SCO1/SenC/PrrC family)
MYGHERSLVQRYQDRPFVLLGVNTDADAETLKQVQEKQHLSWRSWYDGPGGPICQQWRVKGFPSIFLIDAKGVVRYQYNGAPDGEELDRDIETLVKEVEK